MYAGFFILSIFNSGCIGYTTVRPGYVGIKVPLYGSKGDKTEYQNVYGRVWYNSFSTDVYTFPTFMQQVVWTHNAEENRGQDQSISFSTAEGKIINCDVALSYSIKPESVNGVFRDLRMDIDQLTNTYMRSKTRDEFVRIGGRMKVNNVLGAGKENLLKEAKEELNSILGPKGFIIDAVSIVGEMRVDDTVKQAISKTIEAELKAVEAENKVKQSEAEARQAEAVAKGLADAAIQEAEGKAKAILAVAKAQAEANELVKKSISQEIMIMEAIKVWNGQLPTVLSGQGEKFIMDLKNLQGQKQ